MDGGGSWRSGLALLGVLVTILVLGWALNRGPETVVPKIHMHLVCADNGDDTYTCERR